MELSERALDRIEELGPSSGAVQHALQGYAVPRDAQVTKQLVRVMDRGEGKSSRSSWDRILDSRV